MCLIGLNLRSTFCSLSVTHQSGQKGPQKISISSGGSGFTSLSSQPSSTGSFNTACSTLSPILIGGALKGSCSIDKS